MTAKSTLANWTKNIRRFWSRLASIAAFILSILGGFIQPVGTAEDRGTLLRFAPFIVTVLAGIIFLTALRGNQKTPSKWWTWISGLALVLSISSWLVFRSLIFARTCEYANQKVIIGTQYTQRGIEYLTQHPEYSCVDLLKDFAGDTQAVWTKDTINQSRFILEFLYLGCIALLAICLLTLGQAIYGVNNRRRR